MQPLALRLFCRDPWDIVIDMESWDGNTAAESDDAEEPSTKRWVRYAIPVMVEVDCGKDEITRIVALPDEAREDRDDSGHFLFYDEQFVRQSVDGQIPGPPTNWPDMYDWEFGFSYADGTDELYDEINPYADRDTGWF